MRTANIFLSITPGVECKKELVLKDTADLATNLTGYEFRCVCFPWPNATRSITADIAVDDIAAGEITLRFPAAASTAADMYSREQWRGMLLSRLDANAEWRAELIVNLIVEDLV